MAIVLNDTVAVESGVANINDVIGEIIQKVGKQNYSSKSYSNPLSDLRREEINHATQIEEIYVERAMAKEPDPTGANTLDRVQQNIHTLYMKENFAKLYTVTIQNSEVREGFYSVNGIQRLMDRKLEALYRGISVDEYKATELLISKIPTLAGVKTTIIPEIDNQVGALNLIKAVRNDSDNMEFSSTEFCRDYETNTLKADQILIMTPASYHDLKVELAQIFHMDILEFRQRVKIVKEFTDPKVRMILCDKDIIRIHPTLFHVGTQRNEAGMFTNHHVNVKGIYAVCGMYNASVYKIA